MHEVGASAVIGGIQLKTIENAHSIGMVMPRENMKQLYELAGDKDFIDNARTLQLVLKS